MGENRIHGHWSITGGDNPDSDTFDIQGGTYTGAYHRGFKGLAYTLGIVIIAYDDTTNEPSAGFDVAVTVPESGIGTFSFGESADFSRVYSPGHNHHGIPRRDWPPIVDRVQSGAITISTNGGGVVAGSFEFDETLTFEYAVTTNGNTTIGEEVWTHHVEGSFSVPLHTNQNPINYAYEIVDSDIVSGPAAALETYPITIQPRIPDGYEFVGWEFSHYFNYLGEQPDGTIVFNLPPNLLVDLIGEPVRIAARFRELDPPELTVTVITATGTDILRYRTPGETITISTLPIDQGKVFERWEGDIANLADANDFFTTLTMPDASITLTAAYAVTQGFNGVSLPGTYSRWETSKGVSVKETVVLSADGTGSYTDADGTLSLNWDVDADGTLIMDVDSVGEVSYVLVNIAHDEWHILGDVFDEEGNSSIGDIVIYKVAVDEDLPNLQGTLFDVRDDIVKYDSTSSREVDFTVKNISSTGMSKPSFTVNFYLTNSISSIDTTDVLLGSMIVSQQLLGNEDTGVLTANLSLPAELPPDVGVSPGCNYRIGMVIDPNNSVAEEDETDNANFGGGRDYEIVKIEGPAVLKFTSFEAVNPLGAHLPGGMAYVSGTLRNVGYCNALNVELDAVFGNTNIYIGIPEWSTSVGTLFAGDSHPLPFGIDVPPANDPELYPGSGSYYINIRATFEHEADWLTVPPPPVFASADFLVDVPADLFSVNFVATKPFLNSLPWRPSDTVDFALTVTNGGFGDAESTKTEIWLSRDPVFNIGDDYLLQPVVNTPAIPSGANWVHSNPSVTLPTAGHPIWAPQQNRYFLLARVDADDSEREDVEFNNTSSTLFVGAAPIDVSNAQVPPTAGGIITLVPGIPNRFTFTPDPGYEILDVTIDGVPQGAVDAYTAQNMLDDNEIIVAFGLKTYHILSYSSPGGEVAPMSAFVNHGDSKAFTITPLSGYYVSKVLIDNVAVGPINSYTFVDVTEAHALRAIFVRSDDDSDGLDDTWETENFGNTEQAGDDDFDNDGESNADEYGNNTDPADAGSTSNPANRYPARFEIFRRFVANDAAPTFGAAFRAYPRPFTRFRAPATLTFPDASTMSLDLADSGRIATRDMIFAQFSELLSVFPAGSYIVTLTERHVAGRETIVRLRYSLAAYAETEFPDPVLLTAPAANTQNVPVDVDLQFQNANWDLLCLQVEESVRSREYDNTAVTDTLAIVRLPALTTIIATVKNDAANDSPLGTHTISVFRTAAQTRIDVTTGWSLISVPFTTPNQLETARSAPLLSDQFWMFDAVRQQFEMVAEDAMLAPGTGYWVYATSANASTLINGSEEAVALALEGGWNCLGSVRDMPVPGDFGAAWGWDGERYFSVTAGELPAWQENGMLMQGHGYWVFSHR